MTDGTRRKGKEQDSHNNDRALAQQARELLRGFCKRFDIPRITGRIRASKGK